MRWRKKEYPPKQDGLILGWDNNSCCVFLIDFSDGQYMDTDPIHYGNENEGLTHWMPLPRGPHD